MNAELKTLMQQRNRLLRDMGANRDAWIAKTREVLEKTHEAKRNTWRAHLEEVTRTKDAKKAWAVVKSQNGLARVQDGKILVYKGRDYVSDKAKASAFIQEYATVSGRKSDRSSRRAVRELRSGVRRLLGSVVKSLSRLLPLKNWRPPWRPSRRGRLVAQTAWLVTYSTRAGLRDGAHRSGEQRRLSRFWRKRKTHKLWTVNALLLIRPPSRNCLSDSLSIAFLGGWRRSRSSARGKPGSASADVPPTNASDCPSSLAMAFSRQIRNEPFLCSSIILRHTTLSREPVCSRRCLISESRCVSCSGRRLGLLTTLLASNSTG